MAYRLRYHPAVAAEDLPRIPWNVRERIRAALERRLTQTPEVSGKPLRGTLRGYWKLRVGDYRVVYKVERDTVLILAILHRSRVYQFLGQRT